MRRLAGLFLAGILLCSLAGTSPARAASFFQIGVFTPTENLILWTFPTSTWEFGNREAYNDAWWYFLDGGSRAVKIIVRQYGVTYTKINDRNGVQNETSLDPVPSEHVFPVSPDFSHEIGVNTGPIIFVRRDPSNPKVPVVIGGFDPKADDLHDVDVHWYYQGAGVLVATYHTDIILRVWIQTVRDDISWQSPI